MKRFLLGFAALATMVSCVTESGLERPEPRMVSLVTVSPETRTVLDGNDVLWENGDQVKVVFPSDSEPFKGEFTTEFEGAAVSMATFRGLLDDGVDEANGYADGYAVYPKSAVGDDGTVSFAVPVEQRPREDGSFARDANLSASLVDLSDLTEDGTVEVRFRNALALVRFNLPANVASMKVTSATAPLAGAADLAFSDKPGSEGCLVFADAVPVSMLLWNRSGIRTGLQNRSVRGWLIRVTHIRDMAQSGKESMTHLSTSGTRLSCGLVETIR